MKSCTGSVGTTRLDLTAGKPLGKVPLTKTEMQRRWRAKVRRRLLFAEHRDPAALRTPRARPEDKEFWPTPPCLRAALTGWVIPSLPAGVVWEAAAGFGHLADDIEAATGRQVIATDIDPQRHGIGRHDFHDAPRPERPARSWSPIRRGPMNALTNISPASCPCSTAGICAARCCCCSGRITWGPAGAPLFSTVLWQHGRGAGDRPGFRGRKAAGAGGVCGRYGWPARAGRR